MLLTRELHETIALAEMAGIRGSIASVQRLHPEACADSIDVAGGVVAFAGANAPLSKAYGVGSLEPLTNGDIARITEFYESRNTAPRIFVTPMSDPALGRSLASVGYAPAEYDNILVAIDPDAHALRDDRIGVATDLEAWTRASVEGFLSRENIAHDASLAAIVGSSSGVVPLEARERGTIVATAAMSVRGECAALFAGSTRPEFQHRGWQIALIRERISRARDAGASIVYAAAAPGGTSERNFYRCGFRTVYTRARWDRR
jgi:ribosomal protein S18 acetylase RimI-like enzyme